MNHMIISIFTMLGKFFEFMYNGVLLPNYPSILIGSWILIIAAYIFSNDFFRKGEVVAVALVLSIIFPFTIPFIILGLVIFGIAATVDLLRTRVQHRRTKVQSVNVVAALPEPDPYFKDALHEVDELLKEEL